LLPLYEFILLPVHLNFSVNMSVISDVGYQNLIALGNAQAFQTLSSSNSLTVNALVLHFSATEGHPPDQHHQGLSGITLFWSAPNSLGTIAIPDWGDKGEIFSSGTIHG
jgi:hypothetical protein